MKTEFHSEMIINLVEPKFEFSRSLQYKKVISESSGYEKFELGDAIPSSYVQVFEPEIFLDINRKFGLLNGFNMKKEETKIKAKT